MSAIETWDDNKYEYGLEEGIEQGRREERERLRKIIRREQRESPHLASSAFNEFCNDLLAALGED